MLKRFNLNKPGDINLLISCRTLIEGYDTKFANFIVLIDSCNS